MTVTREQVADLNPGDIVELRWPDGTLIRGPLSAMPGGGVWLSEAGWAIRDPQDRAPLLAINVELVVVERKPRPFYVNHSRTEPVEGDVAKPASGQRGEYRPVDGIVSMVWWRWDSQAVGFRWTSTEVFQREGELRLLVDGNTGMAVPFDEDDALTRLVKNQP